MIDVLIAGAGPTGLMLASELGLAGVRATVIEKEAKPSGLSKALGLQARTMEMLDHRGLLERFTTGRRSPPFANFAMFQLDLHAIPFGHPYGVVIPQAEVEQLLEARAREVGAEVCRGEEITGLHQDDGAVTVTVEGPRGPYEIRCRFLVGCDGGHSAVRKLAGIGFPGAGPTVVARFADVTIGQEAWPLLRAAVPELREKDFGLARTARGNFAIVAIAPGVVRVAAIEWDQTEIDRSTPMTLDELQAALRRVIGTTLPMSDPRWMTRAVDNSRQADRYRDGRVFVAGDAAHVHFAYGGMGLQTGVQDAGNLGWKLAAQIRGWAPPGLLDTYDAERQPVGRRVLMATRAATALARPGEHTTALREVFTELLRHEPAYRNVVEMVTSVDVHYEMGGAYARSPLVGRWAPDLTLDMAGKSARVAELMHAGHGVLVDMTHEAAFRDVAAAWSDRVDAVSAKCDAASAPAALLIRPDGYVAWAAQGSDEPRSAATVLRDALERWFGRPTARSR